VVLFTQTANVRSMRLAAKLGFTEVERFEAYGAEQWFGVWSSARLWLDHDEEQSC
jgi:RimJ/RimL family protein N-acetyltransferase